MVEAGLLGRKIGRGFFEHGATTAVARRARAPEAGSEAI
jgi:3-hydroxyacyl-CoA dehydrogenase